MQAVWLLSLTLMLAGCQRALGPGFGPEPPCSANALVVTNASMPTALPVLADNAAVRLQKRVDARITGAQAWEPSMVAQSVGNSADTDQLTLVWMDGRPGSVTDTRIAYARSMDGGNTFQSGDLPKPSQVSAAAPTFDPMTAILPNTHEVLVAAMTRSFTLGSDNTLWSSRHGVDGAPFEASTRLLQQTSVDKGWMAAGPAPGNASQIVLYMAYNAGNRLLSRSLDGGRTIASSLPLPGTIGYQPRVDRNGRLTLTYFDNGRLAFVASDDGGLTLQAPVIVATPTATSLSITTSIPGEFRAPIFLMHAIDPTSGRIYGVYNDVTAQSGNQLDVDILLTYSDDGGLTWSAGSIVNGDGDVPGDQFMPWIEVDARGGVHLAWFDTREHPGLDQDGFALIDVWYAYSADRGQRFTETRLTTQPIDSARTRWAPFGGIGSQFIGDYLALAVSDHAAYVAYPLSENNELGMGLSRIDLPKAGITAGYTGTWINQAEPGHGMLIEILPDNRLLAWWFTFTPDGQQAWFGGIGTYSGNLATIQVIKAQGGRFLPNFNPADIQNPVLGTMQIRFDSCMKGQVDYAFGQGFGSGTWSIDRLTVAAGLNCVD
ncbi:sialidase family protein [Ahniella affigens]|nr:sialidase family protein [Ahniella affigens]